MRNAFAAAATKLASEDQRFVLLSGDIGNQLFDKYKAAAPERFFNCGVAEQNLIGVAAGMAMNGVRPIAYTITPFITSRCFEQIRVDVCYHNVPVTIVGVGSGLSYASLGATHHACEDIALLRSLPHMTVVCPADQAEVSAIMQQLPSYNKPLYIRLGKKGEPSVHDQPITFSIGTPIKLAQSTTSIPDITLLGCGTILPEVKAAAKLLEANGISTETYSFHTVKPLNQEFILDLFSKRKLVVTIEEHSLIGGFGAAVAEMLADTTNTVKAKLLRIGTPDQFLYEAGEQEHARHVFKIDADGIKQQILARCSCL